MGIYSAFYKWTVEQSLQRLNAVRGLPPRIQSSRLHCLRPLLSGLCLLLASCNLALADSTTEQRSLNCLRQQLVEQSRAAVYVATLQHYNQMNINPFSLEQRWSVLNKDSAPLQALIKQEASQAMLELIRRYGLQGEGFLIGLNGGLAALTQQTEDFWQGDEKQFYLAIQLPAGESLLLSNVTDRSSNAFLHKIAIPVFDDKQLPIGVLVIGLDSFVVKLEDYC